MLYSEINALVERLKAEGSLGPEAVPALRQVIFRDDQVSLYEGALLFELNRAGLTPSRDWHQFFPEAIALILVHQVRPEGYVTEEQAEWLIERIEADGKACSRTELEAVLHVMERAQTIPTRLQSFALEAITKAVITGEGRTRPDPTQAEGALEVGVIGENEVSLLRRALYAGAGCRGVAISKAEAEILFDLNDATVQVENNPAWSELFVKAIANYLMAISGLTPPPRDVALRREDWLRSPGGFEGGLAGFFSQMVGGGLSGLVDAFTEPDPIATRAQAIDHERAANEPVTETEAQWLVERIGRDGLLHDNEKALLRFLKEESPSLHPALNPLLERAV